MSDSTVKRYVVSAPPLEDAQVVVLATDYDKLDAWAERVADALCGDAPLNYGDRLRLLTEWEEMYR